MKFRIQGANLCANKDGAVAVEFALVVSAFISFIMGIAYVTIMAFNTVALDWAVKSASRQAEINRSVTQSVITSTINNYLASVGLSNASVTYSVTIANGVSTGNISANSQQTYEIPFIPAIRMTFSSSAAVPLAAS